MKYVYHSSKIQGLKTLKPRVSSHDKAFVYAMEKPEYSSLFLGDCNDFINQIGFSGEMPYIFERFKDSLLYAYKGKSGSIYTLDAKDFKKGLTTWSMELVNENSCKVIKEDKIQDSLDNILKLESEGKLIVYRYPEMPEHFPKDRSDLVKKAIMAIRKYGDSRIDFIKKYHPDIVERVIQGLKLKE